MDGIRFALPETDSQGRTLTAEQRAFFKDSKVVDDKGRLLVVYHGTNDVEVKETWNAERRSFDMEYSPFTVFKKKWEGQAGHFFGKDIDNAGGYGSRIYKCYLNIKNPLVIECNNRDYSVIEYNGQIKDTYEWAEYAKAKGYDGVIFKNIRDGVDYGAMQQSTDEYVVFQSNQIKNIDNTSPTWLADIRYALPETDSTGKKLTEQQRRFFNDSMAVDEKGRLLVVYHGTRNGEFTVFEHGKGRKNDAGWLGEGFYFYGDEHEASIYAMGGGRVIEAYLGGLKFFAQCDKIFLLSLRRTDLCEVCDTHRKKKRGH